jgi:antitoxin Phd
VRKEIWSLENAKNRFSAVVEAARRGRPQTVTKRGRPAVVVLAVEDYERLCKAEIAGAPTFAELLLAIPRDGGIFERADLTPRRIAF